MSQKEEKLKLFKKSRIQSKKIKKKYMNDKYTRHLKNKSKFKINSTKPMSLKKKFIIILKRFLKVINYG